MAIPHFRHAIPPNPYQSVSPHLQRLISFKWRNFLSRGIAPLGVCQPCSIRRLPMGTSEADWRDYAIAPVNNYSASETWKYYWLGYSTIQ